MGLFDNIFGKKKKASADFSNVRSGSSTSAPPPGTSPSVTRTAGPETAAPRVYVVVSGDSLSKIAKREYGDAKKWPKIFDANRDLIKDPDLIHPGQKLTIPSA